MKSETAGRELAYDAHRQLAYPKPRFRGRMHQASFGLSVVAGTWLVTTARGWLHTVALTVYAGSVTALFGTSALYHRVAWRPPAQRVMRRLDHAMIFVLIAGTYTPVLLLSAPRPFGVILLCAIWTGALLGLVIHLVWLDAPERLVGGVYLGLGWFGIVALPAVWHRIGIAGSALLLAGGLLYTAGAIGYHRRRPDPAPGVFGFHEVFHAFVCAAAAGHYAAVAFFVR